MSGNVVTFLSIIVLVSAGYMYYQDKTSDLTYVTSRIDNTRYLVRNLPDKQNACDMLAKIKQNMIILCNHLLKTYPSDENIDRLKRKFDPSQITETSRGEKNTSYTINKGEKIVLCLRARDGNERLERENTMMFVSLHELAHIMTKSIGHDNDEFWSNFKFILTNATELGIYKNVDYRQEPEEYCGMMITDSPLNDSSITINQPKT